MDNEVNLLLDVMLPLTLMFIMFGMGMTLTVRDFIRLKEYPRALVAGLGGQLILLPIVGFLLAMTWGLSPELAIGLIILAACPGGTTSNLTTHLAHGDRPLSITLTAVTSCIVVVTIPILAALAMDYFLGSAPDDIPSPVVQVMFGVFVFTLLPLSLGMLLRRFAPRFAHRFGPLYDKFAALAFAFIVLAVVWAEREDILALLPQVGSVVIALNVIMVALGLLVATLLSLHLRQRLTVAIEIGLQNTPLGMAIAGTLLHGVRGLDGETMLMPAALYGLIMFIPATALIVFGRKRLPSPHASAVSDRATAPQT